MTLTVNFLTSAAPNLTLSINQHLFETSPPTPETLHPRYKLYLSLNQPFRLHCLPPIYADTPPWLLPTPQRDLRLNKLLKSQTPPSHFRALFNEIVNSYPNRLLCFTDGSKRGNRVGCAYSINNRIQNFRHKNTSTVFTAKLQAIHHCLIDLMNLPPSSFSQNFLITSDSLVALLAIRDVNSSHPLVQ